MNCDGENVIIHNLSPLKYVLLVLVLSMNGACVFFYLFHCGMLFMFGFHTMDCMIIHCLIVGITTTLFRYGPFLGNDDGCQFSLVFLCTGCCFACGYNLE